MVRRLVTGIVQGWQAVLWAITLLALLFKGLAALNTDVTHTDTHLYLSIASNYLLRGEVTPYMWRLQDLNILAGSGTGYAIYLLVGWLQWAGLSVLSIHALMFLAGLVSLAVLYHAVWMQWNPQAALVATAFTAVSRMFFEQYYGRMDAFGTLAYACLLWLFVFAHQRSSWGWHALLGVAVIVAAEFHILALLYMAAFALYYALEYFHRLRAARGWVWAGAPLAFFGAALVSGGLYLALHVLPDPHAYFSIASEPTDSSLLVNVGYFIAWLPIEFVALALSLVLLWRTASTHPYAVLLVGWLIGWIVIAPPYWIQYTSHLWPLLAFGVAGLWQLAPSLLHYRRRVTLVLFTAALMLVLRANPLPHVVAFPMMDYAAHRPAAEYIRQHFAPDTVIATAWRFYLFAWMPEYINMMTVDDYESVGIAFRGETYLHYWHTESPQVYYGAANPALKRTQLGDYMKQQQFIQVQPRLWVRADLFHELALTPLEAP
ncbi:MAG: glycosyltransferase family 39 protein [Phototrophicaceae bacterium]|jgi:hypothetical protein